MATLPPSATGHKPAGPRTPSPGLHGENLWRILGHSKFFTDAQIIANAMLDLQGMIEAFQEEHTKTSLTREVKAAKLRTRTRETDEYTEYLAATLLYDLRGISWALEVGREYLNATIIEPFPAATDAQEGGANG